MPWRWATCAKASGLSGSKKTKIGEDHSEVLREGADDLTLTAEEVDTLQACIDVDHIGGTFVGTATGGRRLARFLPSNI